MAKGWTIDKLEGWIHVMPVEDDEAHTTFVWDKNEDLTVCPCRPSIDTKDKIVTHNAFDFREVGEFLKTDAKV